MEIVVWPGNSYPLGAIYDGFGTNFCIFSEKAQRVELCLFDEAGNESKVDLTETTGYRWHGYLPKVKPGQRYGYRIHGPWDPSKGQRFNPAKLLLDPYAKAIEGHVQWNEAIFSYFFNSPEEKNDQNSGPFMPKCVIHEPYFDWTGDVKLQIPWHETIIYEVHVKGFTATHPDVPLEKRGTYAGLVHPLVLEHFKTLGVTAIELMPIHFFVHDKHLMDKGLRNYWGYNTIGFFAPYSEYASDKSPCGSVAEFKEMVKKLHQAKIEVILDVVYNHTAEGNHLGPHLSLKELITRPIIALLKMRDIIWIIPELEIALICAILMYCNC